jgi:glycerophosphoryl diester phosphodiesterase
MLSGLGPLLLFSLVFRGLATLALLPLGTWLVHRLIRAAGHTSVENTDLLGFALSPLGLAALLTASGVLLALRIVETAGFVHLHVRHRGHEQAGLGSSLRAALRAAPRAVGLALLLSLRSMLLVAPFLAGLGLVWVLFLTGQDINAYLHDRPPELWIAAGLGALLVLAALSLLLRLVVRWSLAVPLVLQEDLSAREAARESARRVRGATPRAAALLLGWEALVVAVFAGLGAAYFLAAREALLQAPASRGVVLALTAALVGGRILLSGVEAFVGTAGHASLVLDLYEERGGKAPRRVEGVPLPPRRAGSRWWALAGAAGVLAVVGASAVALDAAARSERPVEVHAHRGASKVAPENSMAAVRAAIEAGADYAEIDVQRTADGVVVMWHDADFARMAGVTTRIEESTWDEIKDVDIGSRFSPRFAGERPARLSDVLDLAHGRIGLQIELKFYGEDRRLAGDVARMVGEKGMEDRVLLSSLVVPSLRLAKEANPRIRTAAIVTVAVGDLSRLDVDALSLGGRVATPSVVRAAQRRGKKVLVWTVDDEASMSDWIDRGVDGIVTNEPALAVRVRAEREERSPAERVLHAARALFGR